MPDEKHEQLVERSQEIDDGLRGILSVLNSREPLTSILDYITASASHLLQADAISLHRLNANTELLTLLASRDLGDAHNVLATLPLGQTVIGQAALEGQAIHVLDAHAPRAASLRVLEKQYRSVLAVPLNIQQERLGALAFYFVQPRSISQEEIEMAVSFCNQAAQVIEEARRREAIQENAVTAERNRIARDLHDSVTQTLFSASLIAEVLPAIWKRDAADAGQSLEELRHLTRAALAEMRTLLLELRPAGLAEGRLEDLLKQLAEGISGRLRSPLEVQVEGEAFLPAEVKLVFYRVAQEAMNNLANHSNAEKGKIELRSVPASRRRKPNGDAPAYSKSARLVIRDNGCGFDPRTVTSEHMGLGIMRERASSVQAALVIHSKPGEGTEVSLTWPAPKQENPT